MNALDCWLCGNWGPDFETKSFRKAQNPPFSTLQNKWVLAKPPEGFLEPPGGF
jgi:hypothetical protein